MQRSLRLTSLFLLTFGFGAAFVSAAELAGSVSDPDGRPAPGVQIHLVTPIGVAATATTGPSGTYAIDGLAAGDYELRVSARGFRAEPASVRLGAEEKRQLDVTLALSAVSESILVTAAQVDVPATQSADSVTVITGADLSARDVANVSDALRTVPGLTVTRSGGHGALTTMFPRGGESNFTLVMVDGVRLNSFGGDYDFAHLPVADIERIEVVRGPQSALFGSDAIGAVVQIVTRRGGTPYAEGLVEAGNFDTSRVLASSAGSWNDWVWGGSVERLASDGFTGTAANGERVTNNDYQRLGTSFGGGWQPDGFSEIRGTVRVQTTEKGFPGPFGSDPGGTFSGVDTIARGDTDTNTVAVTASHAWARVKQRGQLSFADFDGHFADRNFFPPPDVFLSEAETRRLSGRLQTDVVITDAVGLSGGVDINRERASSTFITDEGGSPIPVRRHTEGYFGEGRFNLGGRLSATAGIRFEHIRREALEGNAFVARPAFEQEGELSVNPKISLSYLLLPSTAADGMWTRLHLSAGTGIRPPDAFEIAFTDNPALKPERSRSFAAGVEQALARGTVVFDATAFFNRYDDLIVSVGGLLREASQYQSDNISNARSRGVELSLSARSGFGLESRVSYTWMDTEILSVDQLRLAPTPFTVGDPLLRRPRHQGSFELLYTRDRISAHVSVLGRGSVLDIDPSSGASGGLYDGPGYGVVDTGGTVRVARGIDAFARVGNLLDREYEETLGFPALGRNALIGLRVAAGR